MTLVYGVCALFGGTLLVCQVLLTLVGLHGHDEAAHDLSGDLVDHPDVDAAHDLVDSEHDSHNATWFFGVLTFRAVVAALTFFGLVGLAGSAAEWPPVQTLAHALAAGLLALYGVHWTMRQLARLRSDGTLRLEAAVGRVGTVYLRIPARNQGAGKVHLTLQNRTVELQALTSHDELATGTPVVVQELIGPETVRVEPVPAPHEVSHV